MYDSLLLARPMGQYCFARWLLSSVVVCNAAGGRAGRPPGAWAVGRPTLHGGPVRLRPVRATPGYKCIAITYADGSREVTTTHFTSVCLRVYLFSTRYLKNRCS